MTRVLTYDRCVHLVQFPAYALDLLDRTGKPDHGKIMPALVIAAVLVLHAFHNPLPLGVVITLVAAAFGASTFRAFLRSRTVTASATTSATTRDVHEQRETMTTVRLEDKRDAGGGFEYDAGDRSPA